MKLSSGYLPMFPAYLPIFANPMTALPEKKVNLTPHV